MNQVPSSAPASGMGIKIIIGLVVLAVVAWAIMAYTGDRDDNGMMDDEDRDEMMDGSFSGNIFDLARRGGTQKCTWTTSGEGYEGTGTVYVSGNRFRTDMMGTTQGVAYKAYALSDGTYFYSWSDAAPFGMRMMMTQFEQQQAEAGQGGPAYDPGPSDYNIDYDFTCGAWDEDDAVFTPPADVQFSEFNY